MGTRTKIAMAGGFALAAGLGFAAGRRTQPDPAPADAAFVVPGMQATSSESASAAQPEAVVITSLREVLQLKSKFAQTTALHMLASRKGREGIEQLLEETASLRSDSDRNAATEILYSRFAELDPAAAVDRILRSNDAEIGFLEAVFHAWARGNLQQALLRAASLEDERSKALALRTILLARADLPQSERAAIAARYKIQLPAGSLGPRPDLRTPAGAERSWHEALAVPDLQDRAARLGQLAYLWGRRSPQAALQAAEQVEDAELREQLMHQAISAWAEKSPKEALEWSIASKPSSQRAALIGLAAQVLARNQPQAALELVMTLSRVEQHSLLPQVLQQWSTTDPQAASGWLTAIKDPSLYHSALFTISSSYSKRNPDEALRWASTLPVADAQATMPSIVGRLAAKDPMRAASLINTFPEGEQRDSVMYNVISNWAQNDAPAALAWATRMPAGKGRSNAINTIFNHWVTYDPGAAAQQLAQLSDPTVRDRATMTVIDSEYTELGLAQQLYERIEGREAKQQAALRLHYRFRESDPALAERYRRDAGLPEAAVRR